MGCRRTAGDTKEHRKGPLLGLVAVADADLEITDEGHGCASVRPKTGPLAGFFLALLRSADFSEEEVRRQLGVAIRCGRDGEFLL
jgi:hypothetical protein